MSETENENNDDKLDDFIISEGMSALSRRRWAGKTKEQRSEHGRAMAKQRAKVLPKSVRQRIAAGAAEARIKKYGQKRKKK